MLLKFSNFPRSFNFKISERFRVLFYGGWKIVAVNRGVNRISDHNRFIKVFKTYRIHML